MARDQRRLAAIMSADVVGYSRLMERDEAQTLALLKAHRRDLIDAKLAEYGGRIVKTMGDGLLVEFASVVDAVRCAVDVQRGMGKRNAGLPEDRRIDFRVGINLGDVIIDDGDIFGDGVNVAARLQALAEPGGIFVSRGVRDQVAGKLDLELEDLGPREVKNIARPLEVFRVVFDAPRRVVPPPALPKASSSPARRLLLAGLAVLAVVIAAALTLLLRPDAPIEPYSALDRRMSFAVLPFAAPAGDETATRLATAATEFVTAEREAAKFTVAARANVARAVAAHAAARDIAKALDVHFLIRGNISRAPTGYIADTLIVDGDTERVLETQRIDIPAGDLTPRVRNELVHALDGMTVKAIEVEAERARRKPDGALDVRDLSFRAFADWYSQNGNERGYRAAMAGLERALALAPDDDFALFLMAHINLCECIHGWSKDSGEQQAIGAQALDKYRRRNPDSLYGLYLKANLLDARGQYEEQLLIADAILRRDAANVEGMVTKAYALLKLGRASEAAPVIEEVVAAYDEPYYLATAAAVHYAGGQDRLAIREALRATARMSRETLSNPRQGTVLLTLAAAAARSGEHARAKKAIADFQAAFPGVDTVAAIRTWIKPTAPLAGYEPLYEGLRMAGLREQ